jgi:hypothetical protein
MTLEKIKRVRALLSEFQIRASRVEVEDDEYSGITGTAACGALRRTSMELTRALADLRRPG